jgi:hypothetical protein
VELPGAANGADVTQIGQRAIDRAQADRSAEQLLDAIGDAQPGGTAGPALEKALERFEGQWRGYFVMTLSGKLW